MQEVEEEMVQGLGLGCRERGVQGLPASSCHFLLLLPQHGNLFPTLHHTSSPLHKLGPPPGTPFLYSPASNALTL